MNEEEKKNISILITMVMENTQNNNNVLFFLSFFFFYLRMAVTRVQLQATQPRTSAHVIPSTLANASITTPGTTSADIRRSSIQDSVPLKWLGSFKVSGLGA